jgi:hypothetical protein
MQMPSSWKREALALGASTAAVFIYCFPRLLFLGDVVYCLDAGRMHYPIKLFLAERLRQGQLPLWYPYEGLGTPFVPNAVTALFHPFTVWSLSLSPATAHTVSLLSCIVIAQLGSYWLARRLGAGPAGAACAGIALAASGTVLSSLNNLTFLCGACAFPVWLASLHAAAIDRRLWSFATAAFAFAFALLAGDFQACYLYGVTAVPLLLAFGCGVFRTAVVLAVCGAVGLLLSSVQLIPTLSILHELHRTQGFSYTEAVSWSLPWLRLPELALGDVLRYQPFHLHENKLQLLQLMNYGGRAPWYPNVYLGILGLLAAVWALVIERGSRRRSAVGLLCVGVILVWIALGGHGALYALFYRLLPGWRSFRYPEKMLNYAATLFAVLGGLGVSAALEKPSNAWKIGLAVAAGLLALSGLTAGLRAWVGSLALAIADLADAHLVQPLGEQYASRLLEVLLRASVLAGIAAALLLLAAQRKLVLAKLVPVLLAAAFLIDLTSVNSRAIAMCSGDLESAAGRSLTAEALDALGEKRPGHFRVASNAGYGIVYHPDVDVLAGATYRGAADWDLQSLAADFSAIYHIESTKPYLPAISERYDELLNNHGGVDWRFYWSGLFNGRFEVGDLARLEQDHRPEDVVRRFEEYSVYLARVPEAMPRAFIATPRFVHSREEARAGLSEPDVLSGRIAILEAAAQPGFEAAQGSAEIASYQPERVVVRSRVQAAGVLVLNDAFFDGWLTQVDGVDARIERANYLVRGVLLPAGEHEVVFSYPLPKSIRVGAWLSASTLLLLSLALARELARCRAISRS